MARRILVVEDEAPIREMVCFVLEQNGYQPLEAEDYDSAVTRLSEPFPDLVLLDWMLPGGCAAGSFQPEMRLQPADAEPVDLFHLDLHRNTFFHRLDVADHADGFAGGIQAVQRVQRGIEGFGV